MKDVSSALRTAIIAKLRNNVTVDGVVIPIRAKVNATSASNYIYFPTQNTDNNSAKGYFSTDQTIEIECVYRNNDGNSSGLDSMVNQVMQLIVKHNQIDMPQPNGFGMIDFNFISKTELTDIDDVGYIFRAVLRFEALTDE